MNPKPQTKPAIDRGKVRALRNAGWSAKEIADEMNCSEGTIWNIFSEFKREEK
jgi:orotate phosphoribosyltransferase-like protein